VITVIAELLTTALEIAEPLLGLVSGTRRASTPAPGDFYRARMTLELAGHICGDSDAVFRCVVWPSMMVRVSEEHFAANGDVLVEMHSLTHAASLPPAFHGRANHPGYRLRIPPLILAKSFKAVAPAI